MAGREANSGWSRPWAAFFALIIILGGVAVSLGFGVRLRGALERNAETRVRTTSVSLQGTFAAELARYGDTVRGAAAGLTAVPTPTATAFGVVTAAVDSQELTAVRAITFVVPTTRDGVAAVGPYWRDRGAKGLQPKPAAGLQEHLFPVFGRGLAGNAAPALGVDRGATQAVIDATRLAAAGKDVAVTDAYAQPLFFDVIAPVYGPKAVIGFVVLTVSATEFVSTILQQAAGTLLDAQLLTRSGTGSLVEVATVLQHGGTDTSVRYLQDFEAGQRQWVLRTSAGYATLLPTAGRTDLVVVLAGSVLAVMFGTLMYLQMSAARRTDQEIALEVAEQVEQFEADSDPGRLRRALAVQEALVTDLLAYPMDGAATVHPVDLDLRAAVEEVVADGLHPAGDEPEVAVGDLPLVRADAALLRQVLDTMLAEAVRRAPAHEVAKIEVSADPQALPGRVRLLVESAGTVVVLSLPAAEQMAANQP